MTPTAWFTLLHPLLVILFVYPVLGATVRLGLLARERRLGNNKHPVTTGAQHSHHGRWLTSGVVLAVLIAFLYSFIKTFGSDPAAFNGGSVRLLQLLLAAGGCLASLIALWQARRPLWRGCFALLCWAGLLGLGSQSEIWRMSDNPFHTEFWTSHYWQGVLLGGLLLWSTAAQPEIQSSLRLRRLHVSASVLSAVLLVLLAVTGTKSLLFMAEHLGLSHTH